MSFSALQRAENSSIELMKRLDKMLDRFQCSSASRKFLNYIHLLAVSSLIEVSVLFSEPKIPQFPLARLRARRAARRFSALQRAENSSIMSVQRTVISYGGFQCSSASRKFLNRALGVAERRGRGGAEFQCSSASRKFLNAGGR